jgi:hypothetical protein
MLQRPLLTPLVLGFWVVTTGWLMLTKIVPVFNQGLPPGHQALFASGDRLIPVAWTVTWNERPLGWALSTARRNESGDLAVDTRLHFDHLPLNDMLPSWAGMMVRQMVRDDGLVTLDARGRLDIDAAGSLRRFASTVSVPGANQDVVLTGSIDDGQATVVIEAGGMRYDVVRQIPNHSMVGDELSPQATMPGLYEGRTWTVPVYSPLRPGHAPIEILHAHVGPESTLFWEDGLVRVHVVSYREDSSTRREPRCRLWVDLAGRVLKQEAAMLGSKMTFLRRTDEAAVWLVESVAAREQKEPAGSER